MEKQLEVVGMVVELLKFTKEGDEVVDKLTADLVGFWDWLDWTAKDLLAPSDI